MIRSIRVRAAQMADLVPIADVFTRAHRTLDFLPRIHSADEDLAHWRDTLMVECNVFVAEEQGGAVGVMAVCGNWLAQVQVDPDHFGKGIGSALVRHAQSDHDHLQLWCFQQNRRARDLYERHGFTATEFTDGAGNEEKAPDVRYEWRRSGVPS